MIRQIILLLLWITMTIGPCYQITAQSIKMKLPDINLGCIGDLTAIPSPTPEKVEVRTTCRKGGIKVEHVEDITSNDHCHYRIERKYRASDACGNELIGIQAIIFVYDPLPPDSDQTYYIDLGCNPNLRRAIPNPKSFDPGHCDARVRWLGDERKKDDCFYSLTRKYRIGLCSGKSYVLTQIYNWINDKLPPEIVCEDLDLGCNPDSIPSIFDIPVKDNCGEVQIINPVSSISQDGCAFTITQTITAVDQCGNQSTCTRTIRYIKDEESPVVQRCDRVIDLGCIESRDEVPPPLPAPIIITDNCGDVSVEVVDKELKESDCKSMLTYYYKISDRCGNMTRCRITYTWMHDTIPPMVLNCPEEEIDLGCNPVSIPGIDASRIKVKDNCGIADTLYAIADYLPDGCVYRVGYLYIFVDSCGNKTECFEVFRWTLDNEPPQVEGCGEVIDVPIVDGEPDIPPALPAPLIITDNCGGVLPLEWTDIKNDFGCSGELIRIYTIRDNCGNVTQCRIVYLWKKPLCLDRIVCKGPEDLGCNPNFPDDFPEPDVDSYLEGLDCDITAEVIPDIDPIFFECSYSYSYTIVFTDECGNQKKCREVYTWTVDNEAPEIIRCAPDLDLGCISDLDAFPGHDQSDAIIAVDNCTNITASLVGIEGGVDGCNLEYRQKYSVKDACGNESTCIQTIEFTYDPGLQIPEDMTVFCQVPDPPVLQGTCEEASLKLLIEFDTGCEDNNCEVYRYWQLTSCDGEVTVGIQKISVVCGFSGELAAIPPQKVNRNPVTIFFDEQPINESTIPEDNTTNQEKFIRGELKLYPNPASSYVTLSLENQKPLEGEIILNIYDQYGRLMKNRELESDLGDYHVPIDDLPGGMYVIELISADNRRWTKSFVTLN